ncbi:Signal recognition particle [Paragonimus heterotremus]|uniref:Signal recognition particle n=1 Tax=Paragonimus heterotremus TaxID=100268 RepID=A0A8J4SNN9_9TREM|nr:Signal recognition particle [Paragonimus heterotremus]
MIKAPLEPFDPLLPHSAKERWICIYPCYINSRRTRARGRKISVEKGVDNPKHSEVTFVLGKLGLEHILETKVHPREIDSTEPSVRWRIRVHLKNDDGVPINEQFPNRLSLLLYIANIVTAMRSRRLPMDGSISGSDQGKKGKKKRK